MHYTHPDPQFSGEWSFCPACGYSLAGLLLPPACPECGVSLPPILLVLHGVRKVKSNISWSAKLALAAFVLLPFLGLSLLSLMGLGFDWLALTALAVGGIGLLILVIFIRGSQNSVIVRCLIWSGGMLLDPVKLRPDKNEASTALAWDGDEAYELKRVSPHWRELTVRQRFTDKPLVQLGFRCPDASYSLVEEGLAAAFNPPPHAPPPRESPAYTPP